MAHPKDLQYALANELNKAGHSKKLMAEMNKFMYGFKYDEKQIEKIAVVVYAYMKRTLDDFFEKLPDDAVDASMMIETYKGNASRGRQADKLVPDEGDVVTIIDQKELRKQRKEKK